VPLARNFIGNIEKTGFQQRFVLLEPCFM